VVEGCGGSVLCADHGDPARYACIAVGHRAAHVLLPVGNLTNPNSLAGENDRRRQTLGEDDVHAVTAKGVCNSLRDGFGAHDKRLS
jgi:hypothetical protein